MAITLTLPAAGGVLITDIPDIIDFISVEATVTAFSATQITGNGTYNGSTSSFVANGTGFAIGFVGGEPTVTGGVIDNISFTSSLGTIDITSVDIDMVVFAPIIQADNNGSAPLGIEAFMMSKPWDITLSDLNDVAPFGALVGDGMAFNTIGNDIIRGMGGDDNLFTGDGKDKLFGNSGKDILDGGLGGDLIRGGIGADKLIGNKGNDKLFGDGGKDILKGGLNKDVLDGGAANDVLTGGGGADKFVFKDGYGRDKITDFAAKNNLEDIDLRAVTAITGFVDLKNNHMSQVGTNVVIDDNAGTEIVLVGIDLADLHKADFIF